MKITTLITDNHRTVYPSDVITTTEDSKLTVESITVFWNYNNVIRGVNDTWTHNGNTLTVPEGYWTSDMITGIRDRHVIRVKTSSGEYNDVIAQMYFEKNGSGGWSAYSSHGSYNINLGTFGTLLGFDKNTLLPPQTRKISQNTADLNLGLKYVTVSCDLVDETRNVDPNDNRSGVVATIPVPTNTDLKQTIGHYYLDTKLSIPLRTGIHNKVTFNVNTNLGIKTVGDILVELYVT